MRFHEALEHVEHSKVFKEFKDSKEDFYLAHGFTVLEKGNQAPWQIGYYSKKLDRIVAFTADKEVSKGNEEEAFKKEGAVPSLHEGSVQTSLEEALHVAQQFKNKEHSAENVIKKIVILQTLDNTPTWNITLITHAFSMINVRVHAKTGKTISTSVSNILSLGSRV